MQGEKERAPELSAPCRTYVEYFIVFLLPFGATEMSNSLDEQINKTTKMLFY
jgi:hypothetical protein